MISASEPLEFVPHGRTVADEHPSKIDPVERLSSMFEETLLGNDFNVFDVHDVLFKPNENFYDEFWTLREVFYKNNKEPDVKPTKDKNTSTSSTSTLSSRQPSKLSQEISKLLNYVSKKHKLDIDEDQQKTGSANCSSNISKFSMHGANNAPKSRPVHPSTDSCYEEELYVKGTIAVWSKGPVSVSSCGSTGQDNRLTVASYTMESTIKHAHFCDFYIDINNTMLIDALNSQINDPKKYIKIEDTNEHIANDVMPSILLIDNKKMTVYSKTGREFVTCLHFPVKKVWPMKYGVLLEKEPAEMLHCTLSKSRFCETPTSFNKSRNLNMSSKSKPDMTLGYDDINLPTCFSLSHPLNEVTPIIMKTQSHGCQYYCDPDLQIIYVSVNPSIILIYNKKLGTHSLWAIRKALREECLTISNMTMSNTTMSQSCDINTLGCSNARNVTQLGIPVDSPIPPRVSGKPRMKRHSLKYLIEQQSVLAHQSQDQTSMMSTMANNARQTPPSVPLYPDICLDHIWTNHQHLKRDPVVDQSDTKAFIHTDFVGHEYLCYIVKSASKSRLHIVRLQKSHSHGQTSKSNIIVGTTSSLAANDAVPLEHLRMFAYIDDLRNIILQSGSHVVGKLYIGGVLACLINSPYTKPTYNSPLPRRSSLLPSHASDPSPFDDSTLHLLSPVPFATTSTHHVESKESGSNSSGLIGLSDPVANRITLRFKNGSLYKITLPYMSTSAIVARCCQALKTVLPKDIAIQVLANWYGVRNSPGPQDQSEDEEWAMFSDLIYSLIGYNLEELNTQRNPGQKSDILEEVATKKKRKSEVGSQKNWERLLKSPMHVTGSKYLRNVLNFTDLPEEKSEVRVPTTPKRRVTAEVKTLKFNQDSILFPYAGHILYAFHLLYEDCKLNTLLVHEQQLLGRFTYQLARDLRLEKYLTHYWKDHPIVIPFEDESDYHMTIEICKQISFPSYFNEEPPHLMWYLNEAIQLNNVGFFPYLVDVNNLTKTIIEVASLVCDGVGGIQNVGSREGLASSTPRARSRDRDGNNLSAHYQAVVVVYESGLTCWQIQNLPPAVGLFLLSIFAKCRDSPPLGWPPECYELVMREELALQSQYATFEKRQQNQRPIAKWDSSIESVFTLRNAENPEELFGKDEELDYQVKLGMEHLDTKLFRLLYPNDLRIIDVFKMLQSSIPITVGMMHYPEISDHDFLEEQEKYLFAFSTRTFALPVARGMLTYRSLPFVPSEPFAAPVLNVSGRGPPPRRLHIEFGGFNGDNTQCMAWPNFHNGAAAGLALEPYPGQTIDPTWIIFNMPKGNGEISNEQAGLLMAMGINGYLKNMPPMLIYEYLVRCQEMLSIGLLIGYAASYRGTRDIQATKVMTIHLMPLLPPTSADLDINQNIVIAAVLGIGLVYQKSNQSHFAEVLLKEIGKPPGPEMENCVERECYSLAAGLALGFVCAGAGNEVPRTILNTLRLYVFGGDKKMTGQQKDKSKQSSSFAIREGNAINLDVTSPGATVAFGLIYFNSCNKSIASWLDAPSTSYLLEFVRPDLLMLRSLARGLIMFDLIEPSEEWVENHVPDTIKPHCFIRPVDNTIDYEAINQAYCNIVAGACFAMGLRFAGTRNEDAKETVMNFADRFLTLSGRRIGELAGKSTLETCMCVCLLAGAMIMAGTGDIDIIRFCGELRDRVAIASRANRGPPLTYGGQMAVHCALATLFMGGGRFTFDITATSIAALITAFFPKFPIHSEDNRYHLQAFRHLYALAIVPRLFLTRELNTGMLCHANVQIVSRWGVIEELKAPFVMPKFEQDVMEVRVNDTRYWPVVFHVDRNWDQLLSMLRNTWCIDIKPRAGFLSYLEDQDGYLTMLGQTLTLEKTNVWALTPDNTEFFTSDTKTRSFVENYLHEHEEDEPIVCDKCKNGNEECDEGDVDMDSECECEALVPKGDDNEFIQKMNVVTYDCLVKDIPLAIPLWVSFIKIMKSMTRDPSSYKVWQVRLLLSHVSTSTSDTNEDVDMEQEYDEFDDADSDDQSDDFDFEEEEPQANNIVSTELALAISQKVEYEFDKIFPEMTTYFRRYLGLPSARKLNKCTDFMKKTLSAYVSFYGIRKYSMRNQRISPNLDWMLQEMDRLNINLHTVDKVSGIL